MKYIDAEKLKAEIEKRAKFHNDAMKACIGLNNVAITHSAGWKEDTELLTIINSLQQEQPDVDLEKALNGLDSAYFDLDGIAVMGATYYLTVNDLKDIARDFYELGLNARKED